MSTEGRRPSGPTQDSLRDLLAGHLHALHRIDHHEFVDLDLALSLHDKLEALLDRWHTFTGDQQQLIGQTVHYLVETDDEEHDWRSPISFVDDAEQVEALLRDVAPDLLT